MHLKSQPEKSPMFEVGKTYLTRSIGDHDCIITVAVINRTAKTIKALVDGKPKTLRISTQEGRETVKPWGTFSMAPSVSA